MDIELSRVRNRVKNHTLEFCDTWNTTINSSSWFIDELIVVRERERAMDSSLWGGKFVDETTKMRL
jgi:hypothetical protein